MSTSDFNYVDQLPVGPRETKMRLLTTEGVRVTGVGDDAILEVTPDAIELLANEAFRDVSHFLRSEHLAQRRRIIDDPETAPNDREVALELLQNANVATGGVLPMCQDTGTAIVSAKRGAPHHDRWGGCPAPLARHLQRLP